MQVRMILAGLCAGALAGCSAGGVGGHGPSIQAAAKAETSVQPAPVRYAAAGTVDAPDNGSLVQLDRDTQPVRRGASTWYPVSLSERHALRAIASGQLVVDVPGEAPVRLQYDRHVEHADGNWTWIGHVAGEAGREAILTFGPKAAFATIPDGAGSLQLTMARGRPWLVKSGAGAAPMGTLDNDVLVPSVSMVSRAGAAVARVAGLTARQPATPEYVRGITPARDVQPASLGPKPATNLFHGTVSPEYVRGVSVRPDQAVATTEPVDIVIGYTTGFADRLGGQSQALTRLNYMVDVANQAYANSQVAGRLRLVRAVQVNYPDATVNRTALMELTGVQCTSNTNGAHHLPDSSLNCTSVGQPSSLAPLIQARNAYGGDIVALVRKFEYPENQSCGISWMLGGGQVGIGAPDADYAFSVISDSSGATFPDSGNICRDETLAHETGHTFGLQHDRVTAAGSDDTNGDGNLLDPQEYGSLPYAFGYRTDSAGGNFYTIMTPRQSGQTGYRVFSNPRVTFCGGKPCGVADSEDNARALDVNMPLVAAFRQQVVNFTDVPSTYWAYDAIIRLYAAGVTGGCNTNPMMFCPTATVTRDQMAVFLLRGIHGGGYNPPVATTSRYQDVPPGFWALSWIEELSNESLSGGCSAIPPKFCPASPVNRDQMAVFLLRAKYGANFVPPPATGVFTDVPTTYWAAPWIEKLAADGITGGCSTSPKKFCPGSAVTRDQMAVFLVRTFNL